MSPVVLISGFLSALAALASPVPAPQAARVELHGASRIPPEPGACCLMFAPCQLLTETECMQLGGWFMGEGIPCVSHGMETCPTWGACCMPDGSCTLDTDEHCGAVSWTFISNISCDPSPCSEGACCVEDGLCFQEVQAHCSGTWMVNTACSPNPCLPPGVGACCLADAQCDLLSTLDCQGQQGHFMGMGIACNPNPCWPVPVEKTTWGRVKGRYR
jgi:hypothetical protein